MERKDDLNMQLWSSTSLFKKKKLQRAITLKINKNLFSRYKIDVFTELGTQMRFQLKQKCR